MFRFLFLLIIVTVPGYSQVQYLTFTTSQRYVESPVVAKNTSLRMNTAALPRGLRMRNTGRILAICGGALAIGGIVLMNHADQLYYTSTTTSNGSVEEGDPKGALGVLMTISGVGMAVPGIIFWTKGQKKYNRYLEQQKVSLKSNPTGITICYSF